MAALLHPDTHFAGPLLPIESDPELTAHAEHGLFASSSSHGASVLRPGGAAPWNEPGLRLIAGGLDRPVVAANPHPVGGAAPAVGRLLRTVVAGLALASVLALAALGALTLLGADAAATVPASSAVINHPTGVDATTTPSTPVEVVVQSGDTLWTIARRLRPTGEIRGLVDALAERVGGSTLDAGQHIDISGLLPR